MSSINKLVGDGAAEGHARNIGTGERAWLSLILEPVLAVATIRFTKVKFESFDEQFRS